MFRIIGPACRKTLMLLLCYNVIDAAKGISVSGVGKREGVAGGGESLAKITKYLSISSKGQRKASSSHTLFVPPNY